MLDHIIERAARSRKIGIWGVFKWLDGRRSTLK
jgi:hypothetical protein